MERKIIDTTPIRAKSKYADYMRVYMRQRRADPVLREKLAEKQREYDRRRAERDRIKRQQQTPA